MADINKDGSGTGYQARVTEDNRLDVSSRINDRIYYKSKFEQSAFSNHFHFTQNVAGASEYMGYLSYTGNKILILNQLFVCAEDAGMTIISLSLDATYTSGGAELTSIILDRRSANSLNITSYHQNDVTGTPLVISDTGTHWFCVRTDGPSTIVLDFHDSLIMGKENNILIGCANENAASKTRVTLFYYEDSID